VGKPCDVGLQPQSSQECQCEAKGWVGGWGPNSLNLQAECFQSSLKTLNRNWHQRDASAMQDIFSLSCFMSWLLPKMEVQLGRNSSILEKIKEMWDLGFLGSGAALW